MLYHRAFSNVPEGFPKEIIEEFERQTGRKVLCNKPYSGTEVIKTSVKRWSIPELLSSIPQLIPYFKLLLTRTLFPLRRSMSIVALRARFFRVSMALLA